MRRGRRNTTLPNHRRTVAAAAAANAETPGVAAAPRGVLLMEFAMFGALEGAGGKTA